MGLLDGLTGGLSAMLGSSGGSSQAAITHALTGLLAGGNNGGLGGLLDALHGSGLGAQVASWIGTGQNLPVSADQIMQALGGSSGSDIIGRLAQQAGMSHEAVAGHLSEVLPGLIDKLSPNGQLPSGGIDDMLASLSQVMHG
jgi:uncharacterized protein YidB (DUF937 family)